MHLFGHLVAILQQIWKCLAANGNDSGPPYSTTLFLGHHPITWHERYLEFNTNLDVNGGTFSASMISLDVQRNALMYEA